MCVLEDMGLIFIRNETLFHIPKNLTELKTLIKFKSTFHNRLTELVRKYQHFK